VWVRVRVTPEPFCERRGGGWMHTDLYLSLPIYLSVYLSIYLSIGEANLRKEGGGGCIPICIYLCLFISFYLSIGEATL